MNLKDVKKAVRELWELARAGNELALLNLLTFITQDGRDQLTRFIRRPKSRRSGYTTEVLQRTAIRIDEHARAGRLARPKGEAFLSLGGYVRNITKETIRSESASPSAQYPQRIALAEADEQLAPQAKYGFQSARDYPDLEEHLRDLELLNEAIPDLPAKERAVLEARLNGLSNGEIATQTGESDDLVRQRFHRGVAHLAAIIKLRRGKWQA